jgi:hypothetical protein
MKKEMALSAALQLIISFFSIEWGFRGGNVGQKRSDADVDTGESEERMREYGCMQMRQKNCIPPRFTC